MLLIIVLAKSALSQYVWLNAENSIIKINSVVSAEQYVIQTKANKTYHASIINAVWVFDYFAILVFKAKVSRTKNKVIKTVIAKNVISQEQLYALRLSIKSLAAGP